MREPPATLLPDGFLPPKSVLTMHLNPCLQPFREPPALSKNNQLPLSLSLTTQNSQLSDTLSITCRMSSAISGFSLGRYCLTVSHMTLMFIPKYSWIILFLMPFISDQGIFGALSLTDLGMCFEASPIISIVRTTA
ncbi:hypothetical protein MBAV_002041 [Candidatus Magnetobacterium bavaricum]|uniref:Uncharacterized protein n=1 Tax=Candidatus Magnetobacterium bavaricum TaxID=29290 RepID=A0A0F3GV55_9BACT|nr:hypothetical protein MBAV_002041 [Candidatus Magnetobacterium bavaricum]